MTSSTSAKATMRQTTTHTKRDERLGWTTRDEWLCFTEGVLDNGREDAFTATYRSGPISFELSLVACSTRPEVCSLLPALAEAGPEPALPQILPHGFFQGVKF